MTRNSAFLIRFWRIPWRHSIRHRYIQQSNEWVFQKEFCCNSHPKWTMPLITSLVLFIASKILVKNLGKNNFWPSLMKNSFGWRTNTGVGGIWDRFPYVDRHGRNIIKMQPNHRIKEKFFSSWIWVWMRWSSDLCCCVLGRVQEMGSWLRWIANIGVVDLQKDMRWGFDSIVSALGLNRMTWVEDLGSRIPHFVCPDTCHFEFARYHPVMLWSEEFRCF
jgi:hypothetical protein